MNSHNELAKAWIKSYTKKNSTFAKEHNDNQKARCIAYKEAG